MNYNLNKLPSNRKFGLFFTLVFFLLFSYFNYKQKVELSYVFITSSILFLLLSIFSPKTLNLLNICWFKFGIILGKIINPIILGIMFFLVLTPISLFFKLISRDELNLKRKQKTSFWIDKDKNFNKNKSFNDQF